jgi:hypothetical protein
MRIRQVPLVRGGFHLVDGKGCDQKPSSAERLAIGAQDVATILLDSFFKLHHF